MEKLTRADETPAALQSRLVLDLVTVPLKHVPDHVRHRWPAIGRDETLYVQPDVSAVETIDVASVVELAVLPDQCVPNSGTRTDAIRLDPNPFELDFVPPFTVVIPPLDP